MAQSVFHQPRNIELMNKSRNAALRFKNGSPKLREILRERCRNRVKENRQKYVNVLRNNPDNDLKQILTDTLRDEFMEMCSAPKKQLEHTNFELTDDEIIQKELMTLETIYMEAADKEVELIMANYDKLIANEEMVIAALLEDNYIDIIECPVCEHGTVILATNRILCTHCDLVVFAQTSLLHLVSRIEFVSASHKKICHMKPQYTVSYESLRLICSSCSYSNIII